MQPSRRVPQAANSTTCVFLIIFQKIQSSYFKSSDWFLGLLENRLTFFMKIKHPAYLFRINFLKKKELYGITSLLWRVSISKWTILKSTFGNKHPKLIMSDRRSSYSLKQLAILKSTNEQLLLTLLLNSKNLLTSYEK